MAYDLEEQEQLESLKAWWRQYGNTVTWALIAGLLAFAAWSGWNYWQRKQAGEAALLYEQVAKAAESRDVERIKRAAGDDNDAHFEELTYEIFAPGGVAVLAHAHTDNRNRTASDVRHIVTKAGGQLASAGAVTRLFERKGQIIIERAAADEDMLMELALEAGADDFNADENGYEIVTEPNDFEQVHKAIEEKGIATLSAEVTSIALQTTAVDDSGAATVTRLVDELEENDDVSDVFTNAESSDDA